MTFNIGDRVRWQVRNKYRSNPRLQPSFLMYEGIIDSVDTLSVTYTYAGRDENGRDVAKQGRTEFRQLKNGRWIPKHEDRDDPKGRLYLIKDSQECHQD